MTTTPLLPRLEDLNGVQQKRLIESEIALPQLDWDKWIKGLTPPDIDFLYTSPSDPPFSPLSKILQSSLSFIEKGIRLNAWMHRFGHGHEYCFPQNKSCFNIWLQYFFSNEWNKELFFRSPAQFSHFYLQQEKQFLQTLSCFLNSNVFIIPLSKLEDNLFDILQIEFSISKKQPTSPILSFLINQTFKKAWTLIIKRLSPLEIQALSDRNNDFDDNLFHEACWRGQIWVMEDLKNRGFNIEKPNGLNQTPLELALSNGHFHVVSWLKKQNQACFNTTESELTIFQNMAQLWFRQQNHIDFDASTVLNRFCQTARLSMFKALWTKIQNPLIPKTYALSTLQDVVCLIQHAIEDNPKQKKDARLLYLLDTVPIEWWFEKSVSVMLNSTCVFDKIAQSSSPALQHFCGAIIEKQRNLLACQIPFSQSTKNKLKSFSRI